MAAPREFQREAIELHARNLTLGNASGRLSSLEASVAGFGKTFVAAFVSKMIGHPMAVLCPKAVIPHWQKAAEEVGAQVRFVTNYEQVKLAKFSHGGWKVKNRQYRWAVEKPTMLVFDESHRCNERTTQNAKLMVGAAQQGIPSLSMSATAAQSPLDLYSLGYSLGIHNGADFLGWATQHGVYRGSFSWDFDGNPAALKKMNAALFPGHGHRKSFEDIPGFPETQITMYPVSDDSAARKIEKLWQEVGVLETLQEEALEAVTVRLRARQIAELSKIPALAELVQESVLAGNSAVVFLNFKESIRQLESMLKIPSATIEGNQSAGKRQAWIDGFQMDIINVLICQTQAGGVGISLHDTHGNRPRVSYLSPPDSARDLVQALGRIRREGAKTPSVQHILYLKGSVEEKVRKAVERKVHNISLLNDGDLDPLF